MMQEEEWCFPGFPAFQHSDIPSFIPAPIPAHPSFQVQKCLIWPIKYIKHYKSTEYMKRMILSINVIGNEKQKTWQKNTIFKCKMLKGLCPC